MDRNQQLDLLKALAAALEACNQAGEPGEPVVGGINVVPIDRHGNPDVNLHGYDFPDYRPVDLTASGLVEALKLLGGDSELTLRGDRNISRIMQGLEDAVQVDPESLENGKARLMTWMDAYGEGLSADDFRTQHEDLADQLTAVFNEIDARALQTAVLDHREVAMPVALEAIDDVLGDIADPYADEDDEL
jgi:hypothetical protein